MSRLHTQRWSPSVVVLVLATTVTGGSWPQSGLGASMDAEQLFRARASANIPSREQLIAAVVRAQGGDQAARDTVLDGVSNMVAQLARSYSFRYQRVPFMDLVNEGLLGVLHAIGKFDAQRGTAFTTYSRNWAMAYMLRYVKHHRAAFTFGGQETVSNMPGLVQKATATLASQGIEATPQAIADQIGSFKDTVQAALLASGNQWSVQELYQPDSGEERPVLSFWDDGDGPTPGENLDLLRVRAVMDEFREHLNPREQLIFDARIACDEEDALDRPTVGKRLGLTRERVRQLEVQLQERLRIYGCQRLLK